MTGVRTLVHARLADITNRRRLDHVADGETLDRLVLGDASRAVGAADKTDVATALLVAAVVSSLLRLRRQVNSASVPQFAVTESERCIQSEKSPSNLFARISSVPNKIAEASERPRKLLTILESVGRS